MAEAVMEMPQKTASTHRSAFVRGSHQFDIVGYSVRTALGVSNSVRSAAFEAGGRTWALVCCFEPRKLGSICLELLGSYISRDVVAMASLRINEPTGAGRWPAVVWRSIEAHTFPARSSASCPTRTWELFVPNGFKEARYVLDDRLTVHCTVDVLEEEDAAPAETRNCFVSAPPPPSIPQDLHRLLEAEESRCPPDVTFVVEGAEIQAHKLVLSMRSPVFRAEFQGSMKESQRFTRSVRIDGMSASTFRAMLRFIYTDELPMKPKGVASQDACRNKHLARRRAAMARDLLVAADRYDLERLRLMCESILSESIDATTVLATLALVDGRYSCRQLEASCIEYLASGPGTFAAVVATPEYQELRESSVSLVADIAEKVAMHKLAGTCSSSSSITTSSVRPKKSSSAYTTVVAARGTHEFTIPNLSTVLMSTLDIGHGIHFHSASFHVGGYNWRLCVKKVDEPKDHLAVYLLLLSDPGTDKVEAATTLDVVDPNKKSPSPMCRDFIRTFSKEEMAWGYPDFITLASAKSQYVAHDGSLTIYCHVEVASKPESSSVVVGGGTAAATIAVPPSNIAWHLEQLLVREQGLDVEFLLEGETVLRAHRLVLAARAPALHEQAAGAGMEVGGRVRIDGMRAVVFEAVLHFVYTDQLPSSRGLRDDMVMAGDVLAAACRYRLERLKAMCQNVLAESISTGNALRMLNLADRLGCQELKDYCLDYISSSPGVVREVMKSFSSFCN